MSKKIFNRLHIFDLDGTILDSMHIWVNNDVEFVRSKHVECDIEKLEDAMDNIFGIERYEYLSKILYNGSKTAMDVNIEANEFARDKYMQCKLFDGSVNYIKLLKHKGHKVAIGTANMRNMVEPILKNHGILDLFDVVVCNDDLPVVCGRDKTPIYDACVERADSIKTLTTIYEDSAQSLVFAEKSGYFNLRFKHAPSCCIMSEAVETFKKFSDLETYMDEDLCITRHVECYYKMVEDYIESGYHNIQGFELASLNGNIVPMYVYKNVEMYIVPGFIVAVFNHKIHSIRYEELDCLKEWLHYKVMNHTRYFRPTTDITIGIVHLYQPQQTDESEATA